MSAANVEVQVRIPKTRKRKKTSKKRKLTPEEKLVLKKNHTKLRKLQDRWRHGLNAKSDNSPPPRKFMTRSGRISKKPRLFSPSRLGFEDYTDAIETLEEIEEDSQYSHSESDGASNEPPITKDDEDEMREELKGFVVEAEESELSEDGDYVPSEASEESGSELSENSSSSEEEESPEQLKEELEELKYKYLIDDDKKKRPSSRTAPGVNATLVAGNIPAPSPMKRVNYTGVEDEDVVALIDAIVEQENKQEEEEASVKEQKEVPESLPEATPILERQNAVSPEVE